ncbi:DUF4286 family protein [Daejeonella sp.]|jgi:hypothetical protein|uniref:DUF4286 family protein n=1 Tax=Daejeonella sp. TaxID=2805397 RepID=UPI0025C1BC12|nr:DUF4286 family protein [Daejeonella sp.]
MILYNVTIILDNEIQIEWLNWMQKKQIPELMETGYFVSNRLLKILDSPNEGVTYCVQFVAESIEKLNDFKQKHGQFLEANTPTEFNNKLVIFPTAMEFIDNQ